MLNKPALQKVLEGSVNGKSIFGATLSIEGKGVKWTGAAGDISLNQPYFIASTTKLYVTAIVLQLRAQGKIQLEDKLSTYLPKSVLAGLHVYKGKEYSSELTIQHLLAQTSGLPDYFEDKTHGGGSLLKEITSGKDQQWTWQEAVDKSKQLMPLFAPGTKGKVHYSDTNFQLLGRIIEILTGMTFEQVFDERIAKPLKLNHTYVYIDSKDTLPATMYFKKKKLTIPLAMTSFRADGGVVSTSEESLVFLKAFFEGQLFPKTYLPELYQWSRMMFPLEYGVGVMRFKWPRIFSPFKPVPILIGHSGLSGAFAYYVPDKEIFITGTVNQINDPSLSYKMMIKILNTLP